MKKPSITNFVLAVLMACFAPACDEDDEPIGGCQTETIEIGTGFHRDDEPTGASTMEIQSVDFAGGDTYRQAVADLAAVLDTMKVTVYGCSELMHVTGTCWPPYSVRIGLDMIETQSEPIRERLLATPIADRLPVAERPDGYGVFFLTASGATSEWWTLWYEDSIGVLRPSPSRHAGVGMETTEARGEPPELVHPLPLGGDD